MKIDRLMEKKQRLINDLVDSPSRKTSSDLAALRDVTRRINTIRGDL